MEKPLFVFHICLLMQWRFFHAYPLAPADMTAEEDYGEKNPSNALLLQDPSISGKLDDFFKHWKTITSQPPCTTVPPCKKGQKCSEHCYGPSSTNVLFAVCYNQDEKMPIYSAEFLDPTTLTPGKRPKLSFSMDTGTPFSPASQANDKDYSIKDQLKTHKSWKSGNFFLARGHLAPSADFGTNAKFTFVMTNVAPQWQAFNGGNWNIFEAALRDLKERLLIVTGVAEELPKFALKNGVSTPKYYWKAVCDVNKKESIFFYAENPVDSQSTSKDKGCDKIDQTESRGVLHCISIDKARSKFNDWGIPDYAGCNPKKKECQVLLVF